jgi:SAM-dependent methyltransferase
MPDLPYQIIGGIKCYAPDLAYGSDSFPQEAFARLVGIEERHFWFQTRNAVIRCQVERFLGGRSAPAEFLEVGSGSGFVLRLLDTLPCLRVTGADIHITGIELARSRVPQVEILQLDAAHMPFENRFDAIGIFDVLEHIEDDDRALAEIHRALKPEGLVFITVPQHPILWSSRDAMAGHKRRYTRPGLRACLARQGFRVEFAGSFCFTLFPLLLLLRSMSRKTEDSCIDQLESVEFAPPALINRTLRDLARIDEWLIRRNFALPFGGSLIAVARKLGGHAPLLPVSVVTGGDAVSRPSARSFQLGAVR